MTRTLLTFGASRNVRPSYFEAPVSPATIQPPKSHPSSLQNLTSPDPASLVVNVPPDTAANGSTMLMDDLQGGAENLHPENNRDGFSDVNKLDPLQIADPAHQFHDNPLPSAAAKYADVNEGDFAIDVEPQKQGTARMGMPGRMFVETMLTLFVYLALLCFIGLLLGRIDAFEGPATSFVVCDGALCLNKLFAHTNQSWWFVFAPLGAIGVVSLALHIYALATMKIRAAVDWLYFQDSGRVSVSIWGNIFFVTTELLLVLQLEGTLNSQVGQQVSIALIPLFALGLVGFPLAFARRRALRLYFFAGSMLFLGFLVLFLLRSDGWVLWNWWIAIAPMIALCLMILIVCVSDAWKRSSSLLTSMVVLASARQVQQKARSTLYVSVTMGMTAFAMCVSSIAVADVLQGSVVFSWDAAVLPIATLFPIHLLWAILDMTTALFSRLPGLRRLCLWNDLQSDPVLGIDVLQDTLPRVVSAGWGDTLFRTLCYCLLSVSALAWAFHLETAAYYSWDGVFWTAVRDNLWLALTPLWVLAALAILICIFLLSTRAEVGLTVAMQRLLQRVGASSIFIFGSPFVTGTAVLATALVEGMYLHYPFSRFLRVTSTGNAPALGMRLVLLPLVLVGLCLMVLSPFLKTSTKKGERVAVHGVSLGTYVLIQSFMYYLKSDGFVMWHWAWVFTPTFFASTVGMIYCLMNALSKVSSFNSALASYLTWMLNFAVLGAEGGKLWVLFKMIL